MTGSQILGWVIAPAFATVLTACIIYTITTLRQRARSNRINKNLNRDDR